MIFIDNRLVWMIIVLCFFSGCENFCGKNFHDDFSGSILIEQDASVRDRYYRTSDEYSGVLTLSQMQLLLDFMINIDRDLALETPIVFIEAKTRHGECFVVLGFGGADDMYYIAEIETETHTVRYIDLYFY